MKASTRAKHQALLAILLTALPTFAVVSGAAQSPIYDQKPGNFTTDALLYMGNEAFNNNDYVSAAMELFAYVQRNPPALNDSTFRANFYQVYNYSRDQLTVAVAAQQAAAQSAASLPGTSTAGLSRQKPHLKLPAGLVLK